jgi:GAF domain-containing protein
MTSSDTQTLRHLQQENIRLRNDINALQEYVNRLQKSLTALVSLHDRATTITSETNVFHLIHEILVFALNAVESSNGSLLLLDDETGELVYVDVVGPARGGLLNRRMEKGLGLAGWVVKNHQSRLVEDARRDPYFSITIDNYAGVETQSMICTPLMDSHRPLGAIEAISAQTGRPFIEIDKEVMAVVGHLASNAIIAAERIQA